MNKRSIILIWSMALSVSALAQNHAHEAGSQARSESAEIVLKSVIPGTPTRGLYVQNPSAGMDFNGDGVPDISFIVTDKALPKLIVIVDGTDPEHRWTVLPEIGDEVALDFSRASVIGFYELDGSNDTKEIVLAEKQLRRYLNPVVIDADGNLLSELKDGTSNTVLLTIQNMEADVTEEVVVFNPQIPQVEIWGVQTE